MLNKEQFETRSNGLLIRAPAKINLSLLIAGKRPDGFHEIETIMAKVNFYDDILIQQTQKTGIELLCQGPHWAPQAEENIVYRAAKILMSTSLPQAGLKITLTKNIPAGTGLGSASSDAAATLIGLNRLLNLQLSREKLAELATELGSDVPFFLDGPLALCTGKGEKNKKFEKIFDFAAILVLPDINVSTKTIYDNYRHDNTTYEQLHNRINSYISKNDIDLAAQMCANMLEKTCFSLYGELAELKASAESLGIRPLCLTGSGSAMFWITDPGDEKRVREHQLQIEESIGCKAVIVSSNRW